MKKSPANYYRTITELLPLSLKKNLKKLGKFLKPGFKPDSLRNYLTQFLILFSVILFIFMAYFVFYYYLKFLETETEYKRVVKELYYWEDVIKKHPNFPDGYYNAAIIATKLREKEKAVRYLNRALEFDPDFTEARELEKQLK